MARKKKPKIIIYHQHTQNGVPYGKKHPQDVTHKKTSTQKQHDFSKRSCTVVIVNK